MLAKVYKNVKRVLVYDPSLMPGDVFVLPEGQDDGKPEAREHPLEPSRRALEAEIRYASRLEALLEKTKQALEGGRWQEEGSALKTEYEVLLKQKEALGPVILAYDSNRPSQKGLPVSASLEENIKTLERLYRLPLNKDLVVRELTIAANPPIKAVIAFIDGMVSSPTLNLAVLNPLMLGDGELNLRQGDLVAEVMQRRLTSNQVERSATFDKVQEAINSGDTALFFDGVAEALLINTKGWEHRSVSKPETEQTVRGAQAGFTENLRVNTALVRTMLRSSDLVTEMITIGERGKVNCALMYLAPVANPVLVAEIRRRIQGITADFVGGTAAIEQFIESPYLFPVPRSVSTERPDRVAVHLAEGRVAFIQEGFPFAQILPMSFFSFFHSAEDFAYGVVAATFLRALRHLGSVISTMLPSFYLAISYFHQEMLPTELVLAVAGARENVPFPALFELVLMELSFELIREAGIRIPGLLGTTIGIVGAIILGQAAVAAHIVSPIVVVIVAITGLASSAIPEYRMAIAARLARFVFLLLAATWGLVGLASGLMVITVGFCSLKSFGVPYLAPVAPRTTPGLDVVTLGPVYRQERRPDELSTLDRQRQPKISKVWTKERPAGEEGEDDL